MKVAIIGVLFTLAVAGSAGIGWWYARESSPHQGPIVLISVDGLRTDDLKAYGGEGDRTPAIDALSADAVVFERAYAHSPLTLPAHASILAGRLPFEHGIRDEAGFTLREEARPLPELLRNRGFDTGAAVSSFLLRPESGVGRGFSFFDAELPSDGTGPAPAAERDSTLTAEAAERWLNGRRGSRFFLFVQIKETEAEAALERLVGELKARDLYDPAVIVLTADHPDVGAGVSLDEDALRVPFLVKQADARGAGLRVIAPVQHIDIVPTVLDLVRAPVPPDLRGRSLRAALEGNERQLGSQPIYAESLAALFRFGAPGKFALANSDYRYIRVAGDEDPAQEPADVPVATRLRGELDQLLEGQALQPPAEISPADEDQLAVLGYLPGVPLVDTPPEPLDPAEETRIADIHRAAAVLTGQRDYLGAISRLRQIVTAHPRLAVVQYQLGRLLGRMERLQEAERALHAAARVEPDNPYIPMTVAGLLGRAGRPEDAWPYAALAVALAEHREDARTRSAAHQAAARVALALGDQELATLHAEAAEREDPSVPMRAYVRGRIAMLDERYDDARSALEEAVGALRDQARAIEDLHLQLGEVLEQLELHAEAEEQFRFELRHFPHNLDAYVRLATLYHAAGRSDDFEAVADGMIQVVTTPAAYDAAARLWTIAGDSERAAALRADARARFRGRPGRARLAAAGLR